MEISLIRKLYPCEVCGREVSIRTKAKKGDNVGKRCCGVCANQGIKRVIKPLARKPYKPKIDNYTEFFDKAVQELIKSPCCQNCGCIINHLYMPHANIAHILPKSKFKSVSKNAYNYVFLCSFKDNGSNCHSQFDDRILERPSMPVFQLALQKFVKFQHECLEQGRERTIFEENLV